MEAIFARSIDFTYVGPSPAVNAYARANGRDIRVTAGAMRGGEALVVRGDTITKIEDFRDKTIATPQLGNTQDVECRAWLINNGIRVTLVGGDARVLPTANPDILSLFQQGKLDAAWTVEPWVSRLLSEAGGRIFLEPENTVTTVLAAREEFLTKNPEVARKFVAAHQELTRWIRDHPEEAQRRVRDELSALTRKEISLALVQQAWTDEVQRLLGTLSPMESRILRWRFGLDDEEELTLKEIGDKYNLSRERIRQLQEQALGKIRKALKD